jgi:hypothetical protein
MKNITELTQVKKELVKENKRLVDKNARLEAKLVTANNKLKTQPPAIKPEIMIEAIKRAYGNTVTENSIQTIEQDIENSDKSPEEKSKAKQMLFGALECGGVIYDKIKIIFN